jgi:hypothetical protein
MCDNEGGVGKVRIDGRSGKANPQPPKMWSARRDTCRPWSPHHVTNTIRHWTAPSPGSANYRGIYDSTPRLYHETALLKKNRFPCAPIPASTCNSGALRLEMRDEAVILGRVIDVHATAITNISHPTSANTRLRPSLEGHFDSARCSLFPYAVYAALWTATVSSI